MAASVVERLRAQRAQALKPKHLTLEVPGFDGLLHVRYHPADWDDTAALMERDDHDPKAALASNIDALLAAGPQLRVRIGEEEHPTLERDELGLVSLADTLRAQGETVHGEVGFDEVAVDALGLDIPAHDDSKARATVLEAFAGAVSPELAIRRHAVRIAAWMQGVAQEVAASIMGG